MLESDEKVIDYSALGNAINDSWGKASTAAGASQAVKVTLMLDNTMKVTYLTIVNLVSSTLGQDLQKKYADEANQIVDKRLKQIKDEYKEQSEKTVKFKQVSDADSLEIINLNIYNGLKTAYYRRTFTYEIG